MPANFTSTRGEALVADVALIACSKSKADHERPAATLYTSPLFRKSLLHALGEAKRVFVLSAEHGVVPLDRRLEPYDRTLKTLGRAEVSHWAAMVESQLSTILKSKMTVAMYSGLDYSAPLRSAFARYQCRVEYPLGRLPLGGRLAFLRRVNEEERTENDLRSFYRIIRELHSAQEGGRRLGDTTGRSGWPQRGIYFFTEDGEARVQGVPRITRIGTHAVSEGSKTTLWHRLSTHRGTGHGGGSHRSSIFRLHVGRALTSRKSDISRPASWAIGQTATADIRKAEEFLERKVSETIGGMRLLWLDIGDNAGARSDRAYLERNCIGLLSRWYILNFVRRTSWLGSKSDDWRIAASGLWNLDHLFTLPDIKFLPVLQQYVDATIGRIPPISESIAPRDWHQRLSPLGSSSQLTLFSD